GVFGVSGTFMARQVSGTSAFANKSVANFSAACPTPAGNCKVTTPIVGSPCIPPGYETVVVDPPGGSDVPPVGLPSEAILSVGVGGPDLPGQPLAFGVHVAGINPDSLPPNVFWRVIWSGPGGQRYVDVTNCATGGLASHYGHFTSTGSALDGAADGFTIKP